MTDELRPELRLLRERLARTLDAARAQAQARRHANGYRTARENVADLVDEGSFQEYGQLAVAAQRTRRDYEDLQTSTAADGIITGTCTINAQLVGAARARAVARVHAEPERDLILRSEKERRACGSPANQDGPGAPSGVSERLVPALEHVIERSRPRFEREEVLRPGIDALVLAASSASRRGEVKERVPGHAIRVPASGPNSAYDVGTVPLPATSRGSHLA